MTESMPGDVKKIVNRTTWACGWEYLVD